METMPNSFWDVFVGATSPCGRHRKHGETRLLCRMTDDKTLRVQKIISVNPLSANATVSWLCDLADKHSVTISGVAQPTMIGPTLLGEKTYKLGMSIERLLRWYKYYGFECEEFEGKFHVTRRPKNEIQSKG